MEKGSAETEEEAKLRTGTRGVVGQATRSRVALGDKMIRWSGQIEGLVGLGPRVDRKDLCLKTHDVGVRGSIATSFAVPATTPEQ